MKSTQTNAIKRIIKSASGLPWDCLKGVFIDKSGCFCACDGFRAVRLNKRPEGLPTAAGCDISVFFDNYEGGEHLLLPSVECLKYHIKNKIPYDFGDGMPHVNPRFLLDMLRIFPDAAAYMGRGVNDKIMFYSAYGDGILMPLRQEATAK